MNYEDVISIANPKKGEARGVVTAKQAEASLGRGLKAVSATYGFDLHEDDPRFTVVGTRREGGKAVVTYGARGRRLDADQLAYELNN